MPVLLKGEKTGLYQAEDVENLVSEVRERLCLKSCVKLCSHRRVAPYRHRKRHTSVHEHTCEKHYSSPESCVCQNGCKHITTSSISACVCKQRKSSKIHESETLQDPHVLLEKLIAEQSLIQEAVRRLQSQHSKSSSSSCPSSSSKLFSLDNDSGDQPSTCNETPSFSEMDDDSVLQLSVDI